MLSPVLSNLVVIYFLEIPECLGFVKEAENCILVNDNCENTNKEFFTIHTFYRLEDCDTNALSTNFGKIVLSFILESKKTFFVIELTNRFFNI